MSLIFIFASCGPQPASVLLPIGNPVSNPDPVEFTPETTLVTRTDLTYTTVQSAVATPRVMQDLSFGVSGTVTQVHVGMLDFVRQGEVLAELDPADHQALIDRSEIDMQLLELRKLQRELDALSSANSLEDAREALVLARRRGDRNAVSRWQLSIQRTELNIEMTKLNDIIFEMDYEKAHKAHDELVSNLEKTTMLAPTDGYILYDANIAIGDKADPRTVVFTYVSTADILLHITSRDAIYFWGQENVNITIGEDSYRAYSYTPVRGDAIWKAANLPLTQAFLAFRFPPRNLQAESTVSVHILIEKANALTIPRRCIRVIAGDTYVDIFDGDLVISVPVELGIVSGGIVEVISGLSEGDTVIVR